MALYKIKDFDPNYRDHFNGDDIKNLDLYSGNDRIGSVDDVLVDEEGRFRYLVINTGAWIFGKRVLLPIGRARIDYNARRVYADALTKDQVEQLPTYSDDMLRDYDYDYEEQVRGVYRPGVVSSSAPLDASAGLDTPTPVDANYAATGERRTTDRNVFDRNRAASFNRDSYRYDEEPGLFGMNERDHQNLRLYEERLIANKRREKTGEVVVGKHVETEVARTSVPIEKERVVIERTTPTNAGTAVNPGDVDFHEGEVARVEVYEEVPDIRKEAYVREEVNVKKLVDQDTVNAEEELRREELDIDTQGRPIVEKRPDLL